MTTLPRHRCDKRSTFTGSYRHALRSMPENMEGLAPTTGAADLPGNAG